MKNIFLILLFLPLFSIAQKTWNISDSGRMKPIVLSDSVNMISNNSVAPYMRVSKTTAIAALNNTWTTINFSTNASTQDTNKFSIDTSTGKKYVWLDTTLTNRTMKFSSKSDANYLMTLYMSFVTTAISTRLTLQYRFVIPNGVSAGVDYYFPFPNTGGYEDFYEATIIASGTMNVAKVIPLYLSNTLRTNGMYLQVRLSSNLAIGTCSLNNIALLIQQTK